ncbi:hypothetical protein [Lysinibacillus sp. ZYM-1]|uniref:hypothetical protein n=1 Tax=Lysinibacillus sp. ZYM-1 TaxID=1681184 RepID=UPI0006CEA36D|nr:hypothetical protein [Lysinibacillus sp. ZYM-1]KPN97748.1 hypothetical protein AO843_11300 [Lysinibacillus sp. ZYM-1]
MNEKEAHRKYLQEIQARMEMKAQANPKIAQALQLSQALQDAYASCEGNKSLYAIKRAQILAQHGSTTVDWEQKYTELQAEISRLQTELLLADTDRAIYKGQLEMNGIDPVI